MKLIYAQGACSLSVHILLEEMKVNYQPIKVDLKDKTVLEQYNPKGYVPALILDDGTLLTEATSILQYLSLDHDSAFFPSDPIRRTKCIEWLTFISTELHKGAAPLFNRDQLKPEFLEEVLGKIDNRLEFLDDHLKERAFIMENDYTVADMYALAILRILAHIKVDLKKFQSISNYKKNLEDNSLIKQIIEFESEADIQDSFDASSPIYNNQSLPGSSALGL